MKKKIIIVITSTLVLATIIVLVTIRKYNQVGHVDNVEIVDPVSSIYPKADFDKAFDYIIERFKITYGGSELRKLSY